MDPVPYEFTEDDIDEVLNAYESAGGGRFPEDVRVEIRRHVLRNVVDLGDIVRAAPETEAPGTRTLTGRVGPIAERPGEQSGDRRELALAAIEDLLIRDGLIDIDADEARVFPVVRDQDTERDDA
jgi:hypothetical protein